MREFLGRSAMSFLEMEPFKTWPFERTVDDDLEEHVIEYVFGEHGLELHCDSDESIHTIFLFADDHGGFDEGLSVVPFSLTRDQTLEYFGVPTKSGERQHIPDLGEHCAWDRFERDGATVHIEYRLDCDQIRMITLMRSDKVPV